MTEQTFKLERQTDELARIVSGDHIVAELVWTDSFWAASIPTSPGATARRMVPFVDLNEIEDVGVAYARAVADGHFTAKGADLDIFLDPPTFVGPTDGERACWLYTAWKLMEQGHSVDFREWGESDFAAVNAVYRRVVRKYGDSPPDKADAIGELVAR